ncbi:MAG: 5-methyltetrahydropteroyltriglutamate--homocysteine S-methyltransferase [Elsteraceae bacterium]
MERTLPPFRADQVGSLLRPQALREARAAHAAGVMSDIALTAIEDQQIELAIERQEAIGLRAVTDGEYRRAMWHFDFLERLEGVESYEAAQGIQFKGVQTKAKGLKVTGKIRFAGHPMIDHFRFVRDHATVAAKMTIPSPSVLHFRGGRHAIDPAIYPDMTEFYRDLGQAYQDAVRAFADAGCRYLQLDETNLAYLCDPEQRQMLSERGDDPEQLPRIYAEMINHAIADRPSDMVISMHLCRGNFRSSWIAQGGYEPIAQILFNEINADAYFMEYDTDRAGGFEPLRFVPKGKTVVLGLVTSKTGQLESTDELKRRIEAASAYLDLDQLCLSPQCGFASTEEGNLLAEEEQWAKLTRIVEVAREVWGSA